MRRAACAFFALTFAVPVAAGPVVVATSRSAFNAAGGPGVVEDFTISEGTAAVVTGPLNASSSYPAQFHFGSVHAGDIVRGVTFSSPGATDPITGELSFKFGIDHGGFAAFNESFLSTFTRQQPAPQPILVSFDRPVLAFGFDTDHIYTGDTFTATVRFSDGTSEVQTVNNDQADGEGGFYGFVSNDVDIVGATLLGDGSTGQAFAMDNFTFAIPLPPALLVAPVAGLCVAAAIRRHRKL